MSVVKKSLSILVLTCAAALMCITFNCKAFAAEQESTTDQSVTATTLQSPAYLPSNANGWVETGGKVQYYRDYEPITGWLVDSSYKDYGIQRYYFGSDTYLVKSASISKDDAGYWAYARPEGYVVRGVYDNGAGRVFTADNDGRLPDNTGWLVTGDFTNGVLQRYYINSSDHGANTAFFDVDNNRYWGEGGLGYVLRGNGIRQNYKISANNDGQLLKSGWLCTADYGQGFQRYWFKDYSVPTQGHYATSGNTYTYVTSAGYVLRGVYDNGAGHVFLANNDGKLESTPGWLITSAYSDNGLQRYYIDEKVPAAISSTFQVGKSWYYGIGGVGYVLRGVLDSGAGYVYLANNDGVLESNEGWLVTSAYAGSIQRYYIDSSLHAAKSSIFQINTKWYYGLGGVGYVLRGVMDNGCGRVYLANNEGTLESNEGWLVTSAYAGSVQRYYIDSNAHAAISSFFTISGSNYYGIGGVGYVMRGKMHYGAGILLADNDGKLESNEGWLVTDKYDGHIERYRLDHSCAGHIGAHTGLFSIDGNLYYGRDNEGYVVRNEPMWLSPRIYMANNDGVLVWQNYCANVGGLMQNPELPSGCESCALTIALRAMGYPLAKCTIADNYMPLSSGDFVNAFSGNPHYGGGIYAPGIVTTANNYLSSVGSPFRAYDVSGSSFEQLAEYANNGVPVVIWTTMYMAAPGWSGHWCCGRQWYNNEHAVCMYGTANGAVNVSDSLSGMVARDYNAFRSLYYQCGAMAVIIH